MPGPRRMSTDLGWVGFDVSNGISPDTRYVRVATGLDYRDAAPVSGTRYGAGGETLVGRDRRCSSSSPDRRSR